MNKTLHKKYTEKAWLGGELSIQRALKM